MSLRGIQIDIPGLGPLDIRHLVTDYTGTLSHGGVAATEVKELLAQITGRLEVHVLTSDTFHTVRRELAPLHLQIHILDGDGHDRQKEEFATTQLDPAHIAAIGNGANDRLMLRAVNQAGGLAIAVDNGEGCAVETMGAASIFVTGASNALELLLDPRRLKATLRR
ncbi:MAG: ATPase P [bacterium]|nr:ATPase P [bacterium]